MAGNQLSIYVRPSIWAALNAIGDAYPVNRSERLDLVCERYMALMEHTLQALDLSAEEWLAVLEANHRRPYGHPDHIWANVIPADPKLAMKLQALPLVALIAIQEACDRFWSQPRPSKKTLAEIGIGHP
jgi:hypothetical protein